MKFIINLFVYSGPAGPAVAVPLFSICTVSMVYLFSTTTTNIHIGNYNYNCINKLNHQIRIFKLNSSFQALISQILIL